MTTKKRNAQRRKARDIAARKKDEERLKGVRASVAETADRRIFTGNLAAPTTNGLGLQPGDQLVPSRDLRFTSEEMEQIGLMAEFHLSSHDDAATPLEYDLLESINEKASAAQAE